MNIVLKMNNPTEIEKKMYRSYGLYVIQEDKETVVYAPVHADNEQYRTNNGNRAYSFPKKLEIPEENIETNNMITFDKLSETISINGYWDKDAIFLITNRLVELKFK